MAAPSPPVAQVPLPPRSGGLESTVHRSFLPVLTVCFCSLPNLLKVNNITVPIYDARAIHTFDIEQTQKLPAWDAEVNENSAVMVVATVQKYNRSGSLVPGLGLNVQAVVILADPDHAPQDIDPDADPVREPFPYNPLPDAQD